MGQMRDETQPITHLPSLSTWTWGCLCLGETHCFLICTNTCHGQPKLLIPLGYWGACFPPNVQQKLRKEAGSLKHDGSSFLATCSNGHTDTDVLKNTELQGFPGGPVIKSSHSNTGDSSSMPGWGTKIPHAGGPPSPCTTITEAHVPQLESPCPRT